MNIAVADKTLAIRLISILFTGCGLCEHSPIRHTLAFFLDLYLEKSYNYNSLGKSQGTRRMNKKQLLRLERGCILFWLPKWLPLIGSFGCPVF